MLALQDEFIAALQAATKFLAVVVSGHSFTGALHAALLTGR